MHEAGAARSNRVLGEGGGCFPISDGGWPRAKAGAGALDPIERRALLCSRHPSSQGGCPESWPALTWTFIRVTLSPPASRKPLEDPPPDMLLKMLKAATARTAMRRKLVNPPMPKPP